MNSTVPKELARRYVVYLFLSLAVSVPLVLFTMWFGAAGGVALSGAGIIFLLAQNRNPSSGLRLRKKSPQVSSMKFSQARQAWILVAVVLSLLALLLWNKNVRWHTVMFAGYGTFVVDALVRLWLNRHSFRHQARASMMVQLSAEHAMEIIKPPLRDDLRAEVTFEGLQASFITRFSWASAGERVVLRVEKTTASTCRILVESWSFQTSFSIDERNVAEVLSLIEGPLSAVAGAQAQSFDAAKARHQETELRLARLQAQVEAHFLYNTLAHLGALIERDTDGAKRMLSELVEYLRRSARLLATEVTSLKEEFQLINGYLTLMRHRLGTRLDFDLSLPQHLEDHRCLPGSVLTLVENAVKHGIEPGAGGGRIAVEALVEGERVRAVVTDSGVGFQAVGGSGTGLANLKERLFSRYGAKGDLDLEQLTQGVKASLSFPRELPSGPESTMNLAPALSPAPHVSP